MIGFVVGTVIAIGIIKAVRYRRWRRYGHMHGHYGRGGWGGRGRFINLLDRLRLTPEQRDSVREARTEVKTALQDVRSTLAGIREDVALALSAPAFEEELVGATSAKLDAAVDTLRKTLISLVGRAHTTLDEDQRLELARLIQSAGGRRPQQAGAFL